MADIVSGVIGMFGSYAESGAEREAALKNVDYYRAQAVEEGVAALDREAVRRQQLRKQLGQQVVDTAKSGVGFSGSAILALKESIEMGEQDMLALTKQGKQQVDDFMRAARGEMDYAVQARRNRLFGVGRGAANTYGNAQRSKQPTNRSAQTGINDKNANSGGGFSDGDDYRWSDDA